MKNEQIVRAFDLIAAGAETKDRVWENACRKRRERGAGRRLALSVLAAAAVFCLVFFGGPLLKSENEEDLFTVTAYALNEGEDGPLWFTESGIVDEGPQDWGGYFDPDSKTMYVGLAFNCDGAEVTSLEVSTENGFFARQYVGDLPEQYLGDLSFEEMNELSSFGHTGLDWLGYSGSMRSGYKLFMTSREVDAIGKTMTVDRESLDDYLFFWAVHYEVPAGEDPVFFVPEFPAELRFQAAATLKNGKSAEQEIVIDLSGYGSISGKGTDEMETAIHETISGFSKLVDSIPLEECVPDKERTRHGLTFGDTFQYLAAGPDEYFPFTIDEETPRLLNDFGGALRISAYLPTDGSDGHYVTLNNNGDGTFSVITHIVPGDVILRYYEGGAILKSSVYTQTESYDSWPPEGEETAAEEP